MLLPALQLLEQLLRCCDSVCGNGGQVNGLYIYRLYPFKISWSIQDKSCIYIHIYMICIYTGFTMGLGNDMGLHKRHGETVVLEGLGGDPSRHLLIP